MYPFSLNIIPNNLFYKDMAQGSALIYYFINASELT